MPTVPESFLRDIREHPDEDAPRLIFADWLDDHGEEERGRYIREQVAGRVCKVTTSRFRAWFPPFYHDLGYKLTHHKGATTGYMPPPYLTDYMPPPWSQDPDEATLPTPKLVVRRGFLHAVRCSLSTWLSVGPNLVARGDPLQSVVITDRWPLPAAIAEEDACYWWLVETAQQNRGIIPPCLWSVMDYQRSDNPNTQKFYDSYPAAMLALSDACLRWAGATAVLRWQDTIR